MSPSRLQAYESIVMEYIRNYRPYSRKEVIHFQRIKSLSEAIREAANCRMPNGKKHPHQYRIPVESLNEAREKLLKLPLSECPSFDSLHEMVKSEISDIYMIGELTIYDIAHRIGEFLRRPPDFVYLHRGTTDGAYALGLSGVNGKLKVTDLPIPFQRLPAHEIEDCLCIFKSKLQEINNV